MSERDYREVLRRHRREFNLESDVRVLTVVSVATVVLLPLGVLMFVAWRLWHERFGVTEAELAEAKWAEARAAERARRREWERAAAERELVAECGLGLGDALWRDAGALRRCERVLGEFE